METFWFLVLESMEAGVLRAKGECGSGVTAGDAEDNASSTFNMTVSNNVAREDN